MRMTWPASQTGRSTGKNKRAFTFGQQLGCRLAANQKTTETAHTPKVLELRSRHLLQWNVLVIARIEDDNASGRPPGAGRRCQLEQPQYIRFAGGIYDNGRAIVFAKTLDHPLELVDRSAAHEDVKAPRAKRRATAAPSPSSDPTPTTTAVGCMRRSFYLLPFTLYVSAPNGARTNGTNPSKPALRYDSGLPVHTADDVDHQNRQGKNQRPKPHRAMQPCMVNRDPPRQ